MLKDIVSLLKAAKVFKKANAEGEKWEKINPETLTGEDDAQNPDPTKGEQHSGDITMVNTQGKKPPAQEIYNVKQAPLILESVNEKNALVLHASVEKSSDENT
ncbi:hypothetical protein Tco_1270631 [Tanacetum coccineum]